MTFRPKLWAGVGAFAIAGGPVAGLAAPDAGVVMQGQTPEGHPAASPSALRARAAPASGFGGEGGGEGSGRGSGAAPHAVRALPRHRAEPRIHRVPTHPHRHGPGGEGGERGSIQPHAFGGEGGERGDAPLVGAGGEGGEGGVNSRYIFGFTEGADVERYREREIENDTVFRGGKRAGDYFAVSNKTELEYGVSNNLLAAVGAYFTYHNIHNVPGLDDRSRANFNGLSAELKYRILSRYEFPFGLGISIEPEWNRVSGGSGRPENSYALETKLYIDKELVPGTLFAAVNLLYEPEVAHVKEFDVEANRLVNYERESTFGVSGALAYRVLPNLFVGGEVRYLAGYAGTYLNRFEGDAVFVGPTLSWRFTPRALIQAAYSAQVTGGSVDDPGRRLNLDSFERHQARLRLIYEF